MKNRNEIKSEKVTGWMYYNHAAVPTCAPHEEADIIPIEDGRIWTRNGKKPLLARWTSDFDCGRETGWWYVIKEAPFDINSIKAKRRYEINKGIKNFEVRKIENPAEYAEKIYDIAKDAFENYPDKYKPTTSREAYISKVEKWDDGCVFGAFDRESGELAAFAKLRNGNGFYDFEVLKAKRCFEKLGVNAAMVYNILTEFQDELSEGIYICDGQRSIRHETNFQDWLEKYFGFKKAYCTLNVEYNPKIKAIVKILYPIRKLLVPFENITIVYNIMSVLKMEEFVRE